MAGSPRTIAVARSGVAARRGRALESTLRGYLFLLPALAILLGFHFLPVFYAFYVSLFDWGVTAERFVGGENYLRLLRDGQFHQVLANTAWYALGVVPAGLALSLFFALLLNRQLAGRSAYRLAYFLPYITSTIAAAIVFRWIFQPRYGIANAILGALGLPPQRWFEEPRGIVQLFLMPLGVDVPGWASGPSLALISFVVLTIWHAIGFDTVIFLAGLTTVPPELQDAARVDGANRWQTFRFVTLPLLTPTIMFLVIVSTIRAFQAFNWFFVVYSGQPIQQTRVVTIYLFQTAFTYFQMGYASAIAFALFAVILALTLLQMWALRRRVFYGE